jgi:hypothetical protein
MWQLDVEPDVHGVPWSATTFSSSRGELARAGWGWGRKFKGTCVWVRQILWHERYLTLQKSARTLLRGNLLQAAACPPNLLPQFSQMLIILMMMPII